MSVLKLENISKKYRDIILDKISFESGNNEFLIVLGPSGCGKTTLLRIIAGLEKPDTGKIYLDGNDITDLEPKERNISMIFQNFPLYPHLNVFDNLSFPLKILKKSKSEINKKVNDISSQLGISHILYRKSNNLSGGEIQRVSIGKSILKNPKIYLMDEPLSNLDTNIKTQIRLLIRELHNQKDKLTIYVTHDQKEAISIADKILILNNKKIEQYDTPQNIYSNPSNLFVAEFIGDPKINIIEAEIYNDIDNIKLITSFGEIIINENKEKLKKINQNKIILGIRPETISICDEINTKNNYLCGEVVDVEYYGEHYVIWLNEKRKFKIYSNNKLINKTNKIKFNFKEKDILFFDYERKIKI